MVSGLVTSPCDQLRIFSGEARLMRIESKSAMRLALSYGEERYILLSLKSRSQPLRGTCTDHARVAPLFPGHCRVERARARRRSLHNYFLQLICGVSQIFNLTWLLHQFHVKTQAL